MGTWQTPQLVSVMKQMSIAAVKHAQITYLFFSVSSFLFIVIRHAHVTLQLIALIKT